MRRVQSGEGACAYGIGADEFTPLSISVLDCAIIGQLMAEFDRQDEPEAAKRFLLNSLLEQAQRDGVTLSDVEKRMFLFSETSGEPDWEANQLFEAEYSDSEYEAKIAKLLHRSYMHAKKSDDETAGWNAALEAVRDEDFYGLVMVDQARIQRPKPRITVAAKSIARGLMHVDPIYLSAKALIVIAVLFLLLDPWRLGLIRADFGKLLCIAGAVVALWGVGQIQKRALLRRVKNSASG